MVGAFFRDAGAGIVPNNVLERRVGGGTRLVTKAESMRRSTNAAVPDPRRQVRVAVWASDPITLTGLTEMLLGTADVFVVGDA
ncbi:hypothetical protein AB0L13_44240, partial [Saccharopolyspora shandongensis]|uniref:hypothetical protein n=1 Tax=Saccharopolyspora shandongensis TaxID=418495 RepID=UPI00341CE563